MRRKQNSFRFSKNISNEEFIKYINSLDAEYEFSEFIEGKNRSRIKLIHKRCGNIFETSTTNYYRGNNCPICSKKAKLSYEEASERIKTVHDGQFKIFKENYNSEYKNNRSKISVLCNECKNIFERSFCHLMIPSQKCPMCNTYKRHKTTEIVAKQIKDIDPSYELVGEYIDSFHKIKIKHNLCGNDFEILPANFLSHGQRCPVCNKYFTENKIYKYLKEKFPDEIIQRNFSFDDCYYKSKLKFDFYLESRNIIIEYDGEQHYIPIYGEDELNKTKIRDEIKNEYCKNKNIKLVRIPYWEKENIEKILEEVWLKN